MTLNMILKEANKAFTEKKLEELKRKYPNIPYKIYSLTAIASYKNRKRHSYEDQPADLYYHNNKINLKSWYKNGKRHRDGDKPAIIEYFVFYKKIKEKRWYENGLKHRGKNKPAFIKYNKEGKIEEIEYWFNGKRYKPLPPPLQGSEDQTRRDLNYKKP